MQIKKLLLAAAATSLFAAAATAAQLAPIPVTITGTINAACSTSTNALTFAFGTLIAGSSSLSSVKTADVSLNCSTGTAVTFSTDGATQKASYAVGRVTGGTAGTPGTPESTENGFDLANPQGTLTSCLDPDSDVGPGSTPASPVECNTTTAATPGTPGTPGSFTESAKVFLAVVNGAAYDGLDTAIAATGSTQLITLAALVQPSDATEFDEAAKIPSNTGDFTGNGAQLYVNF